MIPDLPFLFAIAGLSGSLAGLAGLVGGLRREDEMRPIDRFRLREIVGFAFANTLIALSVLPIANLLDSLEGAVRVAAFIAVAYVVVISAVLFRRLRAASIALTAWVWVAGLLDVAVFVTGACAVIAGAMAVLEVLLVLMLARPMTAFLFVLDSFDRTADATAASPEAIEPTSSTAPPPPPASS